MRHWAFWPVFFLNILAVRAGSEDTISLPAEAQAQIVVRCAFDLLPPGGYAPLEIAIDNRAAGARTWRFPFSSPAYNFQGDVLTDVAEFTVPGRSARTFRVLVPLLSGAANSYAPLSVKAFGPGAESGSAEVMFNSYSPGKGTPSSFIGMSEGLATRSWSQLQGELKESNIALQGTKFVASELPEDWRAYLGMAGLWLSSNEASQLSPGQRGALHDWVLRGGTLFLCGEANLPTDFSVTGFGEVVPFGRETIDLPATAESIKNLEPARDLTFATEYAVNWPALKTVGEITTNVPLLIGFMGAFALVVGPLNLFVFGGGGRRHRLFWTTPLISLAASLVLWALIVIQDGFGGKGMRFALVRLLPTEKKLVVLQEQLARTGVLLHSDFETREPGVIQPLESSSVTDVTRVTLRNSGAHYGGGWFRSRSLQAHWLELVSSSRAEIVLLNPKEAVEQKAPPIILSTLSAPLDELFYYDKQGQIWHGTKVRTGEKITLENVADIPRLLSADASPRLHHIWDKARNLPGNFYATSREANDLIPTLSSIRWGEPNVVYLGAVTSAPSP